MRAAEDTPRGRFYLLQRRHTLAEIVERGAFVIAECIRVSPPHQKAGGSRDFGSGSQYYLYRCMDDDDTQLFKMEGRHVHWKYDMDLCLDAKNRYNGAKLANGNPVQAYTCEKGDNDNQNWKVI